MNKDKFEASWKELKGKVREKWAKLTDSDITQINGKYDQLSGTLQKRYGYDRQRAENEINSFCDSCKCHGDKETRSQCDKDLRNKPAHRQDVDDHNQEKRRKAG